MSTPPRSANASGVPPRARLAALLSGAAALVCEVAWARPLRLLAGDTALAQALVLAVFFAGMAVGAWIFGRWASRLARPLRTAASVEVGLALAAVLAVPLLFAAQAPHFALLRALGPWANLPLAALVTGVILVVPTALMGGTMPLLVQGLCGRRGPAQMPPAARLLAWNTVGGAAGAVAAGLWLIPALGLHRTGIAAALLCGAAAVLLWCTPAEPHLGEETETIDPRPGISARLALVVAAGAGFLTLSLEVLWARLLSASLSNSAASFALLLGGVLLGLALGAWIAARLDCATRWAPLAGVEIALAAAVLLSGVSEAPALWMLLEMRRWFEITGLPGALLTEALASLLLTLVPATLLGLHLPLLFAAWPGSPAVPGRRWGSLVAINTAGAAAGSLTTVLALLPLLQVRGTAVALAALAFALGVLVWSQGQGPQRWSKAVAGAGFVALAALVLWLPITPPLAPDQRLLARTEGSGANVSVTENLAGERTLLVNDRYVLGGTGGRMLEFRQALIPALLHPHPRRVFHLGLGTGHTAGALAAVPGVERLVTCDNLPGVIGAARRWFAQTNHGLFENPRAEVVVADGRHWLSATDETFDLIVVDNLLPWLAGTGHLATREFFTLLRARLAPGGMVCLWLPLHQVDPRQIAATQRTLAEVFPSTQVWLARPELETSLGLIAAEAPPSLAHLMGDRRFAAPGLAAIRATARLTSPEDVFAGLCAAGVLLGDEVTLTDDQPLLEWWALETFHRDLSRPPALHTSPAMAANWSLISQMRRDAAPHLRKPLGVGAGDVSPEATDPGARVWRRWRTQTALVDGLRALCRGDGGVERIWLDAVAQDPHDPLAPHALSWLLTTLSHSGEDRAAAELGQRAAELVTLETPARIAWAKSLLDSGSHYRARRVVEQVLEEDPNNLDAALVLIRALVVLGYPEEAAALAAETHERHPDNPLVERLLPRRGDSPAAASQHRH